MKSITGIILLLVLFTSCKKDSRNENKISLIAFGSCCSQWAPDLTIFSAIRSKHPDLYIALGDNMYADVAGLENLPFYPAFIELGYNVLGSKEPFKSFKSNVPIIPTWDDHDYGLNNAGKNFPHKSKSKDLFMKFWNIPTDSPIRRHGGVYNAYYYGEGEYKVQIIMLDTRWFLDVLSPEPIAATNDTSKHILGEEEWHWLETELKKPARIRIIGSSTQFCTEHNGYEAWANYPKQMERFFNLIKSTRAEGLFFISGDVHYAELSKRTPDEIYPIYDITSSGLTQLEDSATSNIYRIGEAYTNYNFGMIRINWNENPVTVSQEIYNKTGTKVLQHVVSLNELKFN